MMILALAVSGCRSYHDQLRHDAEQNDAIFQARWFDDAEARAALKQVEHDTIAAAFVKRAEGKKLKRINVYAAPQDFRAAWFNYVENPTDERLAVCKTVAHKYGVDVP